MKYNIGEVYVFNMFINEDDELIFKYIKILDAKQYRNGYRTTSFRYSIVQCYENGSEISEAKDWSEANLDNKIRSKEDQINFLNSYKKDIEKEMEIKLIEVNKKLKELES